MEKATKNTHLNHLEDNVFLGGIDGTRDSIDFLRKFRDLLQGRSKKDHWGSFDVTDSVSEIPLFLDAMWRGGGPDHRNGVKDQAPAFNGQWAGYGQETMHFAVARHGKGSNVAYFDHSVRSTRSIKQMWTLKWHRTYQRHGFERTKKFPAWLGN